MRGEGVREGKEREGGCEEIEMETGRGGGGKRLRWRGGERGAKEEKEMGRGREGGAKERKRWGGSSLGRYVFGSEISYNKAPPRLPGLGC
jgi:hypothetical protein